MCLYGSHYGVRVKDIQREETNYYSQTAACRIDCFPENVVVDPAKRTFVVGVDHQGVFGVRFAENEFTLSEVGPREWWPIVRQHFIGAEVATDIRPNQDPNEDETRERKHH